MKSKAFVIIFKRLLVAKNCLRPESAPLSCFMIFYYDCEGPVFISDNEELGFVT